jgi:hypothetical protein
MMTLGTLRTRPDWCNSFAGDLLGWIGGSVCDNYTIAEVRADQESILRTKTCVNAANPEKCVQDTLKESDRVTAALDKNPPPAGSGGDGGDSSACELQAAIDHPLMSSILGTSYYCTESSSINPLLIGGAAVVVLLLLVRRR